MRLTYNLLAATTLASTALSTCVKWSVIQYLAEHPDYPGVAMNAIIEIGDVTCSREIKYEEMGEESDCWEIYCDDINFGAALSADIDEIQWLSLNDDEDVHSIPVDMQCVDVGFVPFLCDDRGTGDC